MVLSVENRKFVSSCSRSCFYAGPFLVNGHRKFMEERSVFPLDRKKHIDQRLLPIRYGWYPILGFFDLSREKDNENRHAEERTSSLMGRANGFILGGIRKSQNYRPKNEATSRGFRHLWKSSLSVIVRGKKKGRRRTSVPFFFLKFLCWKWSTYKIIDYIVIITLINY